jgi:hypothetical protein
MELKETMNKLICELPPKKIEQKRTFFDYFNKE